MQPTPHSVRLSTSPTPSPPMIGGNHTPAAAAYIPSRSTIRVRNVADETIYHLVFDGNLTKLTVASLKQHLCTIVGCSPSQQSLYLGGRHLLDLDTGSMVGLRDGILLDLEIAGQSRNVPPPPTSSIVDVPHTPTSSNSNTGGMYNYNHNTNTNSTVPAGAGVPVPLHASQQRAWRSIQTPIDHIYDYTGPTHNISTVSASKVRQIRQPNIDAFEIGAHGGGSYHASTRDLLHGSGNNHNAYDDMDVHCVVIEEDDDDCPPSVLPLNNSTSDATRLRYLVPPPTHNPRSLVEDTAIFNADLQWVLEHKKFETERMVREAELRRDEMILSQQAALLEEEFNEMQKALVYENMKAEVVQREIRKSYELAAVCKGTTYPAFVMK
eukprot:PhF_6_TR8690/c0_g1_i1/m.13620